ncbi:MAG TPA: SDR family oxidoreductase [Stellaceae bacterium]|nr:SDR family oxidoreductase [Stellaceae bacterium]
MALNEEKGRTVLVTGGAKRIGAAIARGLAEDGWTVCVHYQNSGAEAQELVRALTRAGHRCFAVKADLSNRAEIESLVPRCIEQAGRLDCLVNNAAHFVHDNLATLSWESWHAHLAPNLTAPLFLSKSFAASLPSGREGVIVNLLDQKVANLNPDFLSYTLSKVALAGLTTVLAMELAPRIRVCGVAPGVTLPSPKQTPAGFAASQRAAPLGRGSSVAEIVAAVRFILASPSMTGSVISIDGGESLTRRPRDVAFDKS